LLYDKPKACKDVFRPSAIENKNPREIGSPGFFAQAGTADYILNGKPAFEGRGNGRFTMFQELPGGGFGKVSLAKEESGIDETGINGAGIGWVWFLFCFNLDNV